MDLEVAFADWLGRIEELLDATDEPAGLRRRVAGMRRELVRPILAFLGGRRSPGAHDVIALFDAVRDYAQTASSEPQRRLERRKRIEDLAAVVRRCFCGEVAQGNSSTVLTPGWSADLDRRGRLIYANGRGHRVQAQKVASRRGGARLLPPPPVGIAPYSDAVRPRDKRGEPGGLVIIEDATRAIVVGDLHGRWDNLKSILEDKDNLDAVRAKRAHLVFTGDAIHPAHSALNDPASYENSFRTMFLIMTLKAQVPSNVHYLIGNHDHAHVGGLPIARGDVRQDVLFERFAVQRFGHEVFERYREFVRSAPVALKLRAPNGWLVLIHAGLTPRVATDERLIDIHVNGPQTPALWDVLWSRKYDDKEMLDRCLDGLGAKLMVTGHTPPTRRRLERYRLEPVFEPVFAHVHHRQVIVNAQANVFGYLDLDLTVPLPDDATDLRAPDGMSAFRLLRHEGGPLHALHMR